jgi:hypothetical protein
MSRTALFVIAVMGLGLSACTNPYDPVQRGLGGSILGAASGAAIEVPEAERGEVVAFVTSLEPEIVEA